MQTITTKYLGPTNHRGSRVKAVCSAKSITIDWNHSLNSDENHWNAAEQLIRDLSWHNNVSQWVAGHLPEGSSHWMVFTGLYEHDIKEVL
jgi:hypothetical protein